jgi:hypothetical protein
LPPEAQLPLDDLVLQAMTRWPNVPAMYGWLRLDRRGHWMLVDRGVPGFDEALHGLGSEITSPPILDFIGRTYRADEQGRWSWQNGPQRVYVDLDLAPLYFRVMGEAPQQSLITHTGYPISVITQAATDDAGNLWLMTDLGVGCIDDRDLGALELSLSDAGEPTTPTAVLLLLGEHPIHPLGAAPSIAFGFDPRPR